MKAPQFPTRWSRKLTKKFAKDLLDYCVAIHPQSGIGITVVETQNGSPINANIAVVPKRFFQIYDASVRDGDGLITTPRIKIASSTIYQDVPASLGPIMVADGDEIYLEVLIATSGRTVTGVTSRTLKHGSGITYDVTGVTDNKFRYRLGSVTVGASTITIAQSAYGPVDGTAYNQWFYLTPTFGISWNGTS